MEGSCLCKGQLDIPFPKLQDIDGPTAVRVKVNDDNLFGSQRRGHVCHCSNCRKVAGGVAGINLIIEESKVEFPNGKDSIKTYADPETLSGTPVNRNFCRDCGCPIFSQTPLYAGKIILKLGIYPKLPVPEWESFVDHKQGWEEALPGTVQYKIKSFGEKVAGSPEKAAPSGL